MSAKVGRAAVTGSLVGDETIPDGPVDRSLLSDCPVNSCLVTFVFFVPRTNSRLKTRHFGKKLRGRQGRADDGAGWGDAIYDDGFAQVRADFCKSGSGLFEDYE